MSTKTDKQAGYKSHKAGSRKGEVHRLFDTKGADAAEKWALAQGLKPGTVKSWFGDWRRAEKASKPEPKAKANTPKAKTVPKKKDGKPKGSKVAKAKDANGRQTVERAENDNAA